MGHYYSEMANGDEISRKAASDRERLDATADEIRTAIAVRGVEYVLADILCSDLVYASLKYVRHSRRKPA